MQLSELIFAIFIIYFIYKLVFNIIVPVTKVSSAFRERVQQMQQEPGSQPTRHATKAGTASTNNKPASSDSEYIDFEEIK